MKQQLKQLFFRLLLSAALIVFCWWIFVQWLSPSMNRHVKAAILYTEESWYAAYYEPLASALRGRGMESEAVCVDDWEKQAIRAIARGADVVVIGTHKPPQDDRVITYAEDQGATLLFIGSTPGEEYLSRYDRAYFIGSRIEYAGELAGQTMADSFMDGRFPDLNGNLLLDYLIASDLPEYPLFPGTLQECEHFGVYTQNALLNLILESAQSDIPEEERVPPVWTDSTVQPEVILCGSFADLEKAIALSAEKGWVGVNYTAFMRSKDQAVEAVEMGCGAIIYYDAKTVSEVLEAMIVNLSDHAAISEGLPYAPSEPGEIWIPYQQFLVPVAEPEPEPSPEVIPEPSAEEAVVPAA